MADPNPAAPEPTPAAPAATPPDPGQTVPLDRFNQVIAESRSAKAERDQLQERLQALEDSQKSDIEKAQTTAQREKARADAAEAKLSKTLRGAALASRANAAGAISADAVVALAEARGLAVDPEKPETLVAAIDAIKESDPMLFNGQGTPAPERQFGVPANTPPGAAPVAPSGDDKLDLGRGLLGAIQSRR
jgi:hypothetical protein